MPTAQSRFDQIHIKLLRAAEHIDELGRGINAFFAIDPFKVTARVRTDRPGVEYVVSHMEPTPPMLAAIAGDAIQCMVTALDHLAWQICCSESNDNPLTPSQIYFPVADNYADYTKNRAKKLPGVAAATLAAFDNVKPYKGGNNALWELHKLNRIEKHRTLLAVGSTTRGVEFGKHAFNALRNSPATPPSLAAKMANAPMPSVLITSGNEGKIPIAVGTVLFGLANEDKSSQNIEFKWGIGLAEPDVATHLNVITALTQYHRTVQQVVIDLRSFLRDTP